MVIDDYADRRSGIRASGHGTPNGLVLNARFATVLTTDMIRLSRRATSSGTPANAGRDTCTVVEKQSQPLTLKDFHMTGLRHPLDLHRWRADGDMGDPRRPISWLFIQAAQSVT